MWIFTVLLPAISCSHVPTQINPSLCLKDMSTWDQVCHPKQTEDTSYRNYVQLLKHVAAECITLGFISLAVVLVVSSYLSLVQGTS
jgi:hypothetical protein